MNSLEVRCFGGVSVEDDGHAIPMNGTRQRHLLASLVAAGDAGCGIDRLLEELWIEPPASRQTAVRMLIGRVRSKLGPDVISTRSGVYELNLGDSQVDIWQFNQLANSTSAADHLSAFELWRGEPFAGVEPSQSIRTAQDRLREQRLAVLQSMAWQVEPGTDARLVLDLVLRGIEAEPYHEALAAAAVAAFYRVGRQAEALALADTCRHRLLEDLGLEAGADLRRVEHAILVQDERALAARRSTTAPATDRPSGLPAMLQARSDSFVGRRELLSVLKTRLVDAMMGPGRIVVLEGPAGIGKSELTRRFIADNTTARTTIRAGQGSMDGQIAYAPIVEALPELKEDLFVLTDSVEPSVGRLRFWQAVEARFSDLARIGPCLLVLDDLHEADSQTLGLLRYLASTALPANLMIIALIRPPEAGSDLAGVVSALDATSVADVNSLAPLEKSEIDELVDRYHGNAAAASRRRFGAAVRRLSGGNPLVATALCRSAAPGLIMPDGLPAAAVDTGIQGPLVALVDDDVAEVLSLAAVIGLEFELDLLAALSGQTIDNLLPLLERASRARMITETAADDWFRFDHALTASSFKARLSQARFRRLNAALAAKVERDDARLVRYIGEAGPEVDPSTALVSLLGAARELKTRLAFAEATAALRNALDLIDPKDKSVRLDTLIDLADCVCRLGASDEARERRAEALELAISLGETSRISAIAMAGLPAGEVVGGDPDRLDLFARIELEKCDPDKRASILGAWARQARLCGRRDQLGWLLEEAERTPSPTIDFERIMQDGLSAEGSSVRRRLNELADSLEPGPDRARTRCYELWAALVEQVPDAAGALFDDVAREVRQTGSARMLWSVSLFDSTLRLCGMRRSASTPDTTLEAGLRLGIPDAFEGFAVQHFLNFWLNDDLPMALSILDGHGSSDISWNVAWDAAIGFAAAAVGQTARARDQLEVVGRRIDEPSQAPWLPAVGAMLAEIGSLIDSGSAAQTARRLLVPRSGQAVLVGLGAAHLGPVDRYLGLAESVIGIAGAEDRLEAALTQADSVGAAVWAARARTNLEEVLR